MRLLIHLNATWLLSADQARSEERNVWSLKAKHLERIKGLMIPSWINVSAKRVKPFSGRCRVFQGGWCRSRWGRRRSQDRRGALRCRSTEILKHTNATHFFHFIHVNSRLACRNTSDTVLMTISVCCWMLFWETLDTDPYLGTPEKPPSFNRQKLDTLGQHRFSDSRTFFLRHYEWQHHWKRE